MTLTTIDSEVLVNGRILLSMPIALRHIGLLSHSSATIELGWNRSSSRDETAGQAYHLDGHVPVSLSERLKYTLTGILSLSSHRLTGDRSSPAFCSACRIVSDSASEIGNSGGRTVVFSKIPNIFNASFVRAR